MAKVKKIGRNILRTNQLLGLFVVATLFVILPLFVYALLTQNLDIRNYAQTPGRCATPVCTTGFDLVCGSPAPSNPSCPVCNCVRNGTGTPTTPPVRTPRPPIGDPNLSPLTMKLRLKLIGVDSGLANNAKVSIRFQNDSLRDDGGNFYNINLTTDPVMLTHVGSGVYETLITSDELPTGSGYYIYVKGEKHLARRYCANTGQTARCTSSGSITLTESSSTTPQILDFTGLPLEPGDVNVQDGIANGSDFNKIKALLSKSCNTLTPDDKLVGDLDYSGCINVRDAFLMRQTLETKYDE